MFRNLSKQEKTNEIISLVLLVILLIVTPIAWQYAQDTLVVHYDDAGKADGMGGRSTLYLFPLVGVIVYAALSIVIHYLVKYRKPMAPGDKEPEHATTVWVIRLVKVVVLAGLIGSVLDVVAQTNPTDKDITTWCYAGQVIVVAFAFIYAGKQVLDKYVKKG